MMPNLVERIEQELFPEPPRKKWAPAARLGGVALVAGIVSAGLGDGLTRIDIDAVTSSVMEVALPDLDIDLSETDPLVASLVGGGAETTDYSTQIDTTSMATELPVMEEQSGDMLSHNEFIRSLAG